MTVRDLREGELVWTTNEAGERIPMPVEQVRRLPVGPDHVMVRVKLDDGRMLRVSPGHLLANGSRVSSLTVGAQLDGSRVRAVSHAPYDEQATYDLQPAGPTGQYWANGILVGSTLRDPR